MRECRFCNIVKKIGDAYKEENKIIADSDKFFAISSVGALVEGWVLIVPKEHSCSMKDLYTGKEFVRFTNTVVQAIIENYGPVIAFEHGPNCEGSETSCGTDHAHIHIVPYNSITKKLDETGLKWENCRASEISNMVGNNEYLFYCDLDGKWEDPNGRVHILEKPISQFFRQVIAEDLGTFEKYNYKTNPDTELTIKTAQRLGKYFNG